MAIGLGDLLRLSPQCPVRWGPWETDTYRLQAMGWELAVSHRDYGDTMQLAMHHRGLRLIGVSHEARWACHDDRPPLFEVQAVTAVDAIRFMESVRLAPLDSFELIDARSRIVDASADTFRRLFAPFDKQAPEIIVAPETVQDLLDRIRSMQAPEQAAIRQRNARRERDADPARRFHASIVTLAA
jgi:hypothetical protein